MGKYDDIIDLPHPTSTKHPRMSLLDRAAQFSPFAALTGHESAIAETARLTDKKPELDEDRKEELNLRLQILRKHISDKPEVSITYFVPDTAKEGGAFLQATGFLKRLDDIERTLILQNGTIIPMDDIYEIEGSAFNPLKSDL